MVIMLSRLTSSNQARTFFAVPRTYSKVRFLRERGRSVVTVVLEYGAVALRGIPVNGPVVQPGPLKRHATDALAITYSDHRNCKK